MRPRLLHPLLDELDRLFRALKGKDHGLNLKKLRALHEKHKKGCKALLVVKGPSKRGK